MWDEAKKTVKVAKIGKSPKQLKRKPRRSQFDRTFFAL
jgi:hypothetical protein